MAKADIDRERIDDTVLALLYLTIHQRAFGVARAWKGFEWETLGRLYDKGFISDPVGKAKSVVLTEEGLQASEALFNSMFVNARDDD